MPVSRRVEHAIGVDEHLPARVGGYRTLEYLSMCGWQIAVVAAMGYLDDDGDPRTGGVLLIAHKPGSPVPEQQASHESVDLAAPRLWARICRYGVPQPVDARHVKKETAA